MNHLKGISPREAFALLHHGGAIVVDIRPEYETSYRVFDIPQVYLLAFDNYKEKFSEIPKDKLLIVVDNVGLKSPEVAAFFLEQGYSQVSYLIGGVVAWDRDGYPLKKNQEYELQGGCACRLKPKKYYK